MGPDTAEIARYLSCPDDGAATAPSSNGLRCTYCGRQFPFLGLNALEMLPFEPTPISPSEMPAWYRDAYVRAFSQAWDQDNDALPFGAPESLSPKVVKLRQRQIAEIFGVLWDGHGDADGVFCDLSAGAGYTTFAAAQRSRLVFHCDLSSAAVRYAYAKATQMGVENMVIVRADYLRPPFRNCMQRLTCLDTLIRGPWHDLRLLANIHQVLSPGGRAVVDFHNWWHNPLRRLGLLRQNFGENRSYSRRDVLQLLGKAGVHEFWVGGFFQEADLQRWPMRALKSFLPATRIMVRVTKS
jgi:SAM-dependent methyltransferase